MGYRTCVESKGKIGLVGRDLVPHLTALQLAIDQEAFRAGAIHVVREEARSGDRRVPVRFAEARQVSQAYEIVELMFEDSRSHVVLDVFEIISPQSVKIIVINRRSTVAIWEER